MRWKLLRRRLTISAPRVAVRSAMPWPLRWAGAAVVLGFCAAISLWAFELGKSLAGLDSQAKEELAELRSENARLRAERDKAQSVLNTSGSLITAERSAQERLAARSANWRPRTAPCGTTWASSRSSSPRPARKPSPSVACRPR